MFFAASLGTFIVVIDQSATSIVTPTIAEHFKIDIPTSQWITLVYILSVTALMMPAGVIADTIGRKKVWIFGLLIFSLASLITSMATNLFFVLMGKISMGIGAAGVQANGVAIVGEVFPDSERGKAMGLHMSVVGVGAVGGQLVGGIIESLFGWRAIYVFMFGFGLLAMFVASFLLKKDQESNVRESTLANLDWLGTILSAAFLSLFILTINFANKIGWSSIYIISSFIISIAIFIIFIAWENFYSNPMLPLQIFKRKMFSLGSLARGLCFTASSFSNLLLPFYLISVIGMPTNEAAMLLIPRAACLVIFGPISGKIADKIGTSIPAFIGMLMSTIAMAIYFSVTLESHIIVIIIASTLEGLGIAIFMAPNSSAIMGSAGRIYYGIVSAFLNLTRNAGHIFGIALPALIVASTMSSLGYDPDLSDIEKLKDIGLRQAYVTAMNKAFFIAMIITICTGALSLFVKQSNAITQTENS